MKAIIVLATVSLVLAGCGKSGSDDVSPGAATAPASSVGGQTDKSQTPMLDCFNNSIYVAGHFISPETGMYVQCGNARDIIPSSGYANGHQTTSGTLGCTQWTQYFGENYLPVELDHSMIICVRQAAIGSVVNVAMIAPDYSEPQHWFDQRPDVKECTPGVNCSSLPNCFHSEALSFDAGLAVEVCFQLPNPF